MLRMYSAGFPLPLIIRRGKGGRGGLGEIAPNPPERTLAAVDAL